MEIIISLQEGESPSAKLDLLKESDRTRFFKSKVHEIAFYFEVNSSIFDRYLGIKKIHTVDMQKARVLRRAYLSLFSPDKAVNLVTDLDYNKVSEDINGLFHRVSGGKL